MAERCPSCGSNLTPDGTGESYVCDTCGDEWPTDTIELVGLAEIAKRAGVVPSAVSNWRKRHADFPQPLALLEAGPVWRWADVAPWLAAHGKNTGRS